MSKTGLLLASFVAAIPGAALVVLLVMAFWNFAEEMETMFRVLAGFTLLASAFITLIPFGLLVFGRKSGGDTTDDEVEAVAEAEQSGDDLKVGDKTMEVDETEAESFADETFSDDEAFAADEDDEFLEAGGSEFDEFETDDDGKR